MGVITEEVCLFCGWVILIIRHTRALSRVTSIRFTPMEGMPCQIIFQVFVFVMDCMCDSNARMRGMYI